MASREIEVFVVCRADAIERGGATGFSLTRIDDSGENWPFPIVVVRTFGNDYIGFVNRCSHDGVRLDIGCGEFFSSDRSFLKCSRHGATFEIDSGLCIDGPCEGKSLEPVALAVVGGEICLCGVQLVEDEGFSDPFAVSDETMDVMIHPDEQA
ncbi:Rieske (2Fe-2S) protein [Bradyrhizobium genosp. P]|uniref:Rieske (2Fe-2S) protein n=1 Tax=Bradyrhizobium genosp. P TaxID=83641 RepID=UPI003CED8328